MAQSNTQNNNKSNTNNDKSSSNPYVPIIGFTLKVLTKAIGVCLFAGMILLIIEVVLLFVVDNPVQASYERYEGVSDFASTGSWFNERNLIQVIENRVTEQIDLQGLINSVEHYVEIAKDKIGSKSSSRSTASNYMVGFSSAFLEKVPDLLRLWVIVTFTWCAKVLTIIAMLLPCLIIIIGGAVDGSVERKIQTFKGERASQDKIEWWFLAFKASSYTVLFLYLAIPNSFQATLIMLPSACLTAFFMRQVVASYKKYM
mgnify:CR=1 FL=1